MEEIVKERIEYSCLLQDIHDIDSLYVMQRITYIAKSTYDSLVKVNVPSNENQRNKLYRIVKEAMRHFIIVYDFKVIYDETIWTPTDIEKDPRIYGGKITIYFKCSPNTDVRLITIYLFKPWYECVLLRDNLYINIFDTKFDLSELNKIGVSYEN